MGVLSHAFNDMAARLERQRADERELLAAVSHELRTPLARIRLLVEIGRQRRQMGRRRWTRSSARRSRSTPSSGELLASARLEFQAVTPKPLDAVEVARRALERAGEPADKLQARAARRSRCDADPTLLARALANLVDNARKHGGGSATAGGHG